MEKHLHPAEFEKFKAFHVAYANLDSKSESYLANLETTMNLAKSFLTAFPVP